MAHKKAQEMENELRNFLIANYGFNAWQDILRIQAKIRKERIAEKKRKLAQMKLIVEISFASLAVLLGLLGVYLFAMYLKA
jgi:hypothetical protein